MHQRLRNELVFRLAHRALSIIGWRLPAQELRGAFDEFYSAFHEELLRHEKETDRMEATLRGVHTYDSGDPAASIGGISSRGLMRRQDSE